MANAQNCLNSSESSLMSNQLTIYTGLQNSENEFMLNDEGSLVEIEILNEERTIFKFEPILTSNKNCTRKIFSENENKNNHFAGQFDEVDSQIMNLTEISLKSCMICLKREGAISMYTKTTSEISFADKIKSFAGVTITNVDGLPNSICSNCAFRIDDSYKLKNQCEVAIRILKNISCLTPDNKDYTNQTIIGKHDEEEIENVVIVEGEKHIDNEDEICESIDKHSKWIYDDTNDKIENENISTDEIEQNDVDHKIIFSKEPHKCDKCNKIFRRKIEMVEHQQTHTTFECQICNRQYKSANSLNLHSLSHKKQPKKYKCQECGIIFQQNKALREHKSLHHFSTKVYECESCDKTFNQKFKLTRHLNRHNKETKFICEICSREFNTVEYLRQHKLIHGAPKYKCAECSKLFTTSSGLRSHFLRHKGIRHSCDQCDLTFSSKNALSTHKKSIHDKIKRYKCVVCDKEYYSSYNYKQHVLLHTGEKPYECEICDNKFVRRQELLSHLDKYHNIKSIARTISKINENCHICNKKFCNSENLRKHIKWHSVSGLNNLQCQVCHKTLSNNLTLKNHMRIHNGDKSYQCHICSKVLVSAYTLEGHLRTHSGEKPYKCRFCTETFSYDSSRTVHERKHTKYTPYKCTVCNKSLNSSAHLKVHMRKHTGEKPFQCTFCDKTFSTNGYLTVHLRLHKGEQRYPCHLCKAKYDRETHLQSHIKQRHTQEDYVDEEITWLEQSESEI